MSASIGPATDRLLVAATVLLVLVVTAAFLPAATVDVGTAGPGTSGEGTVTPTGDSPTESEPEAPVQEDPAGEHPENETQPVDGSDAPDATIRVNASATDGWLVPGESVELSVVRGTEPVPGATVTLGDDAAGETDENGTVSATVPGSPSVVASATLPDGDAIERTLDVADDVEVAFGRPIDREGAVVVAEIQGHPLAGGHVEVDGETTGSLDENGTATVGLPDGNGTAEVVASTGDVAGNATLDLSMDAHVDPGWAVVGSRARAAASYGDLPAQAEVYVVAGDATDRAEEIVAERDPDAVTDANGATVSLPPAPRATIVVSDGETVRATVVDDLLRNLAIGIIVVLCVGGGVILTTLRALRWLDVEPLSLGDRRGGASALDALVALGAALVDGAAAIAALPARLVPTRFPVPGRPAAGSWIDALSRLSLPSLSLPTLSLPTLSVPSLSLTGLSIPRPSPPSFPALGGGDEEDRSVAAVPDDPDAPGDEEGPPTLSERELIRAGVRDLGRLAGVGRVETATPGEIGRRAVDAALPRAPVRRIVRTVRDVEYGGVEPTRERATGVRDAVRQLRDALGDGGEEE